MNLKGLESDLRRATRIVAEVAGVIMDDASVAYVSGDDGWLWEVTACFEYMQSRARRKYFTSLRAQGQTFDDAVNELCEQLPKWTKDRERAKAHKAKP